MDVVAVGIVDVDLNDVEFRHYRKLVGLAAPAQQSEEICQPGSGEGKVLQAQLALGRRLLGDLDEMHYGGLAAVEPGAGKAEGRPRAVHETQHLLVEGHHRRQVGGTNVHMIELCQRHDEVLSPERRGVSVE